MKNKYEIRGDVTVIFIRYKGEYVETLIDTVDLPKAQEYKNSWWAVKGHGSDLYAKGVYYKEGKRIDIKLHRWLTNPTDEEVVDHYNHKTLDNRRSENLRKVSQLGNTQNQIKAHCTNKSTGILGVHKRKNKFCSRITVDGKRRYIGSFDDAETAKGHLDKARAKFLPFSQEANQQHDFNEVSLRIKKNVNMQSGVKGIYWDTESNKWRVVVGRKGKKVNLGRRENLDEAKQLLIQYKLVE